MYLDTSTFVSRVASNTTTIIGSFLPQIGLQKQKKSYPKVQIQVENGRFHIAGLNHWYSYWREPYRLLLTIPWIGFLFLIDLSYVATNALCALIYLAGGDCIANARSSSFLDAFFFSVQTLALIGYGDMYPKTVYANTVVTIEAMVGLVEIAFMARR